MLSDALPPSVTFEPSWKVAPPPVTWKEEVPPVVLIELPRSNSTSRVAVRKVTCLPLAVAAAPLTDTMASRPKLLAVEVAKEPDTAEMATYDFEPKSVELTLRAVPDSWADRPVEAL